MAGHTPWKQVKRKKKGPTEFKKRPNLPRGAHITLYDLRGDAISQKLVDEVIEFATRRIQESDMPHVGIDVRSR